MFKVTFAFENGSTVEAFANAGDNLLEVARECQCGYRCTMFRKRSLRKMSGTVKKRRTGLQRKLLHISG